MCGERRGLERMDVWGVQYHKKIEQDRRRVDGTGIRVHSQGRLVPLRSVHGNGSQEVQLYVKDDDVNKIVRFSPKEISFPTTTT